jgi:translation initiation factor IF-3
MSEEAGLDLVEVGAKSVPPVCRIMDFGQFKYEQARKLREAKKRQRQVTIKEIKFRPRIDQHDYAFKMRHARRFLEHGNKVKFVVQFRGREMAHREFGNAVLERAVGDLTDCGQVETAAKQEGRFLIMVMAPLPATRRKKTPEPQEKGTEPGPESTPPQEAVS